MLLLGGSVLHFLYKHREEALHRDFAELTGRPARVFNLSHVAHTLRDSLIKYRLLGDKRFDLVVVYHGINDTRMNNAPAERYLGDYAHAAWYAKLEGLDRRGRALPWLSLPFSASYASVELGAATGWQAYVPRHFPRAGWLEHGADVKTADTFRANLTELLDLASERGDPVLLMTFAWYLPPDYSLERCRAGELDYEQVTSSGRPVQRRHPTELWGRPDFVARGLAEHNRVIREFATHPAALFVDVARAIPREGTYFHDVCHLSPRGEERWIGSFVPRLREHFARPPGQPAGVTPRSRAPAASRGSRRRAPPPPRSPRSRRSPSAGSRPGETGER